MYWLYFYFGKDAIMDMWQLKHDILDIYDLIKFARDHPNSLGENGISMIENALKATETLMDELDGKEVTFTGSFFVSGKKTTNISNLNWYCETCRKEVIPEHVTFEETHDVKFGGCGNHL